MTETDASLLKRFMDANDPESAYRAGAEDMRERAAKACQELAERWLVIAESLPEQDAVRFFGMDSAACFCQQVIRALPITDISRECSPAVQTEGK